MKKKLIALCFAVLLAVSSMPMFASAEYSVAAESVIEGNLDIQ